MYVLFSCETGGWDRVVGCGTVVRWYGFVFYTHMLIVEVRTKVLCNPGTPISMMSPELDGVANEQDL